MAEKYYRDVAAHPESVFLMHFRWATHGQISVKNSHPFHLAQGGALIHNGVLTIDGLPKETSDSRFLVRNVIDKFPAGWEDQQWWVGLLHKYIGNSNKLAMIFNDGRYLLVNEKAGHWKNELDKTAPGGIWYSNYSYVPRIVTRAPMTTRTVTEDEAGWYDSYIDWRADRDRVLLAELEAEIDAEDCESCETEAHQAPIQLVMGDGKDWCEDCYDDLIPGVDHVCDIPGYILEQIKTNREETKESKRTSGGLVVPYGRMV